MNKPTALKAAVIGAGAWGTALAQQLAWAGQKVRLWAFEPEVVEMVNGQRENRLFLEGVKLEEAISATNDLAEAVEGARLVVMVTPSHVFRAVLGRAAAHLGDDAIIVSCSKGIEDQTGYTMCEVAEDVLDKRYHRRLTALSGPSFAKEVARGVPTAVTVAGRDADTTLLVQHAFATTLFRVYTSPDTVGVEMGGAVKNPLAIASGMVAGLELGYNSQAAMITRGLAEMTRLAMARGGQLATLSGLAGLGDLVLTCTGNLSRNRTVGKRLALGETIEQIQASTRTVAEGVKNTLTVLQIAKRAGVEMPIVQAVKGVIYDGVTPGDALLSLMTRSLKREHYWVANPDQLTSEEG